MTYFGKILPFEIVCNAVCLLVTFFSVMSRTVSTFSPVNWSSGNAFVAGAGGLRFKFRAGQIGHNVANGSPLLRHFFERSCVVRAQ